jgi:hypothetical protein
MTSRKYPLLNNRDWLYDKYIIEKLSARKIASLLGCDDCTVSIWLKKHNIQPRSLSDRQTISRENEQFILNLSVINGSLLGDSGLRKHNKKSENSFAYLYKKNKYKDHIEYFANQILNNLVQDFHIKKQIQKLNGKSYDLWYFKTGVYKELNTLYEIWYPERNNFKKVVPDSLEIDEVLLLHWFLDDGTSYHRRKETSFKKQVDVRFCTDCFSLEQQNILCDKINYRFNLKAKTTKYMNSHRIRIPQSKTGDFYDIIGPPPVPSLAYKWK